MFAPLHGANIPKISFPFPILWEGGRVMGSLALASSILENAIIPIKEGKLCVSLARSAKLTHNTSTLWADTKYILI